MFKEKPEFAMLSMETEHITFLPSLQTPYNRLVSYALLTAVYRLNHSHPQSLTHVIPALLLQEFEIIFL